LRDRDQATLTSHSQSKTGPGDDLDVSMGRLDLREVLVLAAKPVANKTQPTPVMVEAFLAGVSLERAQEARALCELMGRLSGDAATMWGPSIIGFGTHNYRYESGREGVTPAIAFSPRKAAIVFYGLASSLPGEDDLARLGKVTSGKGCVYLKRLKEANLDALEDVIARALAHRLETSDLKGTARQTP
jgi:hypothetical protein